MVVGGAFDETAESESHGDSLCGTDRRELFSRAEEIALARGVTCYELCSRRTVSIGFTFQTSTVGDVSLELVVDLDLASKATDRRSDSGGCASLLYRTQKSVSLSPTEAEYFAMADGRRKRLYLWTFVRRDRDMGCTFVHEDNVDNVGSIHLATNPATIPDSTHIDIRHHFFRGRVARGEFKVVHVCWNLQQAGFLTSKQLRNKEAFRVHPYF